MILKRQPGFREAASFPLDGPGRWRLGILVPGLNIGPMGNLLHGSMRMRRLWCYVHRWLKNVRNRVLTKLRGSWDVVIWVIPVSCEMAEPYHLTQLCIYYFGFSSGFRMENVQINKKHQKHNCKLIFRVSDYFPFFFFFFNTNLFVKPRR